MMKSKISLIVVLAAIVAFGLVPAAYAYHDGGVAKCEGCHTMHNSLNGTVFTKQTDTSTYTKQTEVGKAGPYLLQGVDQSSTCLNCHGKNEATGGSYHIMSLGQPIPVERTPGGDFAWLKKSAKKGHSIVAAEYGLGQDTGKHGMAPGGTYPVGDLACSSCHDPHGKYRQTSNGVFATGGMAISGSGSYGVDPTNGEAVGSYRLLAGVGYKPKSLTNETGVPTFNQNPMFAASPSSYNSSETTTEIIVNYGHGVGAWCQQCHPLMHMMNNGTNGGNMNVHPNDQALGSTTAGLYNSYKGSDGQQTNLQGYTSLVPVTDDDIQQNSSLNGHYSTNATVGNSAQVMCLTCHRAHASAFDSMLRFPMASVMVEDNNGTLEYTFGGYDLPGLSAAEVEAGLYDRTPDTFGGGQRTLCNKCHAKD